MNVSGDPQRDALLLDIKMKMLLTFDLTSMTAVFKNCANLHGMRQQKALGAEDILNI